MNTTTQYVKNLFLTLFILAAVQPPANASTSESKSGTEQKASYSRLNQLINQADEAQIEAEIKLNPDKKDKIIIAGDSWAMFPCLFGSMETMLRDYDHPLTSDKRCVLTSRMGIRADQWIKSGFDKRLKRYLKKDLRIKYVYLSLGGNDMMKYWNTTFSPEMEEKLFLKIYTIMNKTAEAYLKIRPDIKIIFSGYDYGRLTEHNMISLYTRIYNRMMKPSPDQLNELLIRFSKAMYSLSNGKNIFYIHHLGLSHYYDGVPEKGLSKKTTLIPDEIASWDQPLRIGGAPSLMNSKKSMINWIGLSRDAIHLSSQNYYYLMRHTYDNLISHIIHSPELTKPLVQN